MDLPLQTRIATLLVLSRYAGEAGLNVEYASHDTGNKEVTISCDAPRLLADLFRDVEKYDKSAILLRGLALRPLLYPNHQCPVAVTSVVITNKASVDRILSDSPCLTLFVDSNGMIFPSGSCHEPSQVARMVDQVHHVASQLTRARSEMRVRDLALVSQAELQTLKSWNGQSLPLAEKCLHDLVLDNAKIWPEKEAVAAHDGSYTYEQLQTRSAALSVDLIQRGIRPGDKVLICMERSVMVPVAMMAVMRAGAAFIPLDPGQPDGRIRIIIENSGSNFAVACASHEVRMACLGVNVLVLNEGVLKLSISKIVNQTLPIVSLGSTAYVIYTSGSTGRPKGVVIPHSAISTGVLAWIKHVGLTTCCRMIQLLSYSFDASLSEIFYPLVAGGTVCIPSNNERLNDMTAALRSLQCNWAFITPSFARAIPAEHLKQLHGLSLAGEEVVAADIEPRIGDIPNMVTSYGPTECSIICSVQIHQQNKRAVSGDIGYPVGCRLWVVDPENTGQLMPIGAIGELLVEGHIVAAGYLNDELKTRQAFIETPEFVKNDHSQKAKWYRTGDLVRQKPDGSVCFIRRIDDQVKVRGYRVELREVEEALSSSLCHATKSAIVLLKDEKSNTQNLVAVICPKNEDEATASRPTTLSESLCKRMGRTLPSYMIPRIAVHVSDFPVTISGKLDRRKLMEQATAILQVSDPTKASLPGAPWSPYEILLQEWWAKALGSPVQDLHQNLVLLGADSLKAIQLGHYLRGRGLSIKVSDVLGGPTVAQMATCIIGSDGPADKLLIPEPFSLYNADQAKVKSQVPDTVEDIIPCTPVQEGLMVAFQRQPGTYINQISHVTNLPLDTNTLREAWRRTIDKFAILRTRMVYSPTGIVQAVIPRQDDQVYISDSFDGEMNSKFSLMGVGQNLFQVTLLVNGRGVTKMVLTAHHAICDAWSLNQALTQVSRYYKQQGECLYTPFSAFVRLLQNSDAEASNAYWLSRLEDAQIASFPDHEPSLQYQPRTTAVETLCQPVGVDRHAQVTKATLAEAAWALLLQCYTDSDDVTFGLTLNCRTADIQGIAQVNGPTLSTVPTRVKLPNDQDQLGVFLQQVQEQTVNATQHAQLGLTHISQLSPSAANACCFRSLLVVQADLDGLCGTDEDLFNTTRSYSTITLDYPLVLEVTPRKDQYSMRASFDEKILSRAQVARLLSQLGHLITQLENAETGSQMKNINLVCPEDLCQLADWNDQVAPAVEDRIHDAISRQAYLCSQKEAIVTMKDRVTYQELELRSSQLANHLLQQGVQRGAIVPICFEKSVWAVIAMLAVMKTGAAFVSLDPAYPQDRLSFIIKLTDAQIVMASPLTLQRVDALVERTLVISASWFDSHRQVSNDPPDVPISTDTTAFLLFTSGSTGEPKGIIISHSNFCSSMRGHGPVLGITHKSRVFQFSAYTFDVSMGEIWTTLTTGATLCVPSEYDRMNDLAAAIRRLEATWVFLTPTVASHVDPEKVGQVKTLVYGGEAASRENIFSWADRLCLVNSYGPAESSIWASAAVGVSNSHSSKNIGYPVRCALWVIKPGHRDRLLPLGSIGELVIEGPNVASGYFKNEVRTKEAFLQNPVWGRQGDEKPRRCYCTGDLVRLRTDGAIEFMGRKDTQVKIRGLRIELGEIEHQIRNCLDKEVKVAVEMVHPAGGTAKRALAGFICLKIDETASTFLSTRLPSTWGTLIPRLRSHLEAHVPYHMVPSVFVPLCRMPLTGTGKTDRKALRQLISRLTLQEVAAFSNDNSARNPPRTHIQCLLRDIWCSVIGLSLDSVCLEDHWFRSGGDSVLSMRFAQLARDKGLSLSANDLFQNPILENLAEIATMTKQTLSVPEIQPLRPFALLPHTELVDLKAEIEKVYHIVSSNIEDMYPCSPLQEGLIALSMKVGNTYVAQFAFDVPETLDIPKLRAAWRQITEQNAILRTRFVHTSFGTIQIVMKDGFHWQHITGETTESFLKKDKQLPVRYGKPLNRYALLQYEKKTTFIWTSHHALYDGVSVSRLLESVESAYHGCNTLASQPYNLFVQHLQSRDKDASQTYWRTQLEGSRKSSLFFEPHHVASRPTSKFRRTLCITPRSGAEVTQASVLRAAWALLVARYSSSVDVIFGSTVSGRTASLPGIDLVNGPTVATVPIRAQVNPQQSLRDFLRSIHQNATDMVPFEQDGLQYIREWCPDAAAALDFENLFIVQMPANQSSGRSFLELKPIPVDLSHFYSYPINVECTVQHDVVEVLVHYDPAIMDQRQMERLISQFGHVVQELNSSEDQRKLCDVPMVSLEELKLLREWNAFIPPSFCTTLHEAVGEVAMRYPDRTAVTTPEESMSYQDLDYHSSKLAKSLVGSGVTVGERVLLAYGKTRAAIIAILGVLKAGGTAVPINPKHPESRLRSIVYKAGARVALCTEQYRELVIGLVEKVNVFDTDGDISSASASLPKVSPTDVAFLYFTSGSTGIPKGVILEHGHLGASLRGQVVAWDLKPESRVLQFASLAYDAFVAEAFSAFFVGACLCMPSESQCMNELTDACNKLQVTVACLTVTVARTLQVKEIRTLDKLIVGGEPLSRGDLENWARHTQLYGIYGITETSLWCSQTEQLQATSRPAQLGRPFSGAFWVVDPQDSNQLVPIGVLGELLIESPAIARGYLFGNDHMQSPFLDTPTFLQALFPGRGKRVYRTGDLVRYNGNNLLEFVARKDSLVKINGQRIDLSEIENSLKDLLPVSLDVAVQVVDQADRSFLAAFLASRRQDENLACELEQDDSASSRITSLGFEMFSKLAEHLPRHAVPSVTIPITRLPTLLSGKLDRQQLKTFAAQISNNDMVRFQRTIGVAQRPSTEAGHMMAQIWAEILGYPEESLSIEDHFLRMGGDSVKAMKLVSMLYQKGYTLTVDQVFQKPTLSQMISSMRVCSKMGDEWTKEKDGPQDMTMSAGTLLKYMIEATRQCDCDISDIDDVYPTTPVQEALLTSSSDGTGTFVAHLAWKIPPKIDPIQLQKSITSVIQDSSIWRTRFFYADGVLMQCVLRRPDPVLIESQVEDFNWESHVNEDREKPTGLGDPMIRFSIVGDSKAQYLTMKAHHSVYDGWMIPQMFDNFEHFYLGEPLVPTVPFRRFVSYVQSCNKARSENFWKHTLDGCIVPDFPEYPSSDYRPLTSARMIRRLPTPRPTAGFTISTVVRAAWAFLLGQYTSSLDVSFGVTTTGRAAPLSQIDKVNGPCISTTPARVCFDLDQTIESYLEKVQKEGIAAVPHEQIGLQVLRRVSSDCASCCNLRTILVVQTGHIRGGRRLGLEEVEINERQSHPCAINLQCILEGEQMTLDGNYDEKLLDSRQMNRVLRQLEYLVAQLSSTSPFTRLRDLLAISPCDRAEIKQWNSEMPPLQNSLMHSLVEERVRAAPTKVAIDAWDGQLTYEQYDQLATNLGHFLAEKYKVVPDQIIPLHFEKSKWTAVAMYAVLKAGGAYAFIGLQEPPHRIGSMVQTTKARLALASASQAQNLSKYVEDVLAVSPELMQSLPNQSQGVRTFVTPENVAYVLFTSGSTGEPKAALTEHRAGSTSAIEHGTVEEVHSGCRVLQFASYSFDVSTSETFTTLIKGGTVCIPSEEDRLNNLARILNKFEINHTFLTPTVVSLIKPDDVPKLKTLKLGGEALTRDNVTIWADKVKLSNSYGVAECAIRSVFRNGIRPDTDFTNCGWAVGGCVWITSPEDAEQLVPIGAVGELLIEGPTVAREYLGSPDKTAKSFVSPSWLKDLYPERPCRVYRTGDLVKYSADGSIRFVGRSDSQVKINGQRCELREIEHHLCVSAESGLGAAAVPPSGPYRGRLVAVVAINDGLSQGGKLTLSITKPHQQLAASMTKLSTILEDRVPPYMVPTIWIPVNKLPINSSGKLDRISINRWLTTFSTEDQQFVRKISMGEQLDDEYKLNTPLSTTETLLRDIWARVLNYSAEQIVPTTSFFRIGGDSISAMQVAALCHGNQLRINMQDIMRNRTLHQLATCCNSRQKHTPAKQQLHKERWNETFLLGPIQSMFFDLIPEGTNFYDQGFYLRLRVRVSVEAVMKAFSAVVQRHSMLRATFQKKGCQWMQKVSPPSVESQRFRAYSVTDDGCRVWQIIRNTRRQLNIEKGPVFAGALIDQPDQGQTLFLTAHHLVVDLISWRVILRDIEDHVLMRKLLPIESMPYQLWLQQQLQHARENQSSAVFHHRQSDFDYWGVPLDQNTFGNAIEQSLTLSKCATAYIFGDDLPSHRLDPVDVLLGALSFSFGQVFHDRPQITIENEGHGRETWSPNIDLSQTVGWFATKYPVRVGSQYLTDLVNAIRRTRQIRQTAVDNGRKLFAATYYGNANGSTFGKHAVAEICFNFLGQYQQLESEDALFQNLGDPCPERDSSMRRFALLEMDALVEKGSLIFRYEYPVMIQHQDRLRQWLDLFLATLESLSISLNSSPPEPTLSDFPQLKISDADFEAMIKKSLPAAGVPTARLVEDIYPCSPTQHGIFLSQLRDPRKYNVVMYFRVEPVPGSEVISSKKLQGAWEAVVARHSGLRTVILDTMADHGSLLQVVLSHNAPTTSLLQAATESDAMTTLRAQADQIEIVSQPLHTLTICTTGVTGSAFCKLEISHALMDGVSNSVLLSDLEKAYANSLVQGSNSALSAYSYKIHSISREDSLRHWSEYLSGVEACIFPHINTEKPKSMDSFDIEAPSVDTAALRTFCGRQEITVFTIYQLAWAMILRMFTGDTTTCFGFLASDRDLEIPGIQESIGPYINTLVSRVDVSMEESIGETLRRLQKRTLEGLDHRFVSLSDIYHALGINDGALFNTVLSVQRGTTEVVQGKTDCSISVLEILDPTEFDITVNVLDTLEDHQVVLTIKSAAMPKSFAERLAHTLTQTVNSIISTGQNDMLSHVQTVSSFDLVQIHHWNNQENKSVPRCVHDLIQEVMYSHSTDTAVSAWDGDFTYEELDILSAKCAAALMSNGVGRETFVPFCFEKTRWTVVAILGIMRAGGVCVPLEPSHPHERREATMKQLQAPVIMSSEKHISTCQGMANELVVLGDAYRPQLEAKVGQIATTQPSSAVYVIFTSGSTGVPKGVVWDHATLASSILAHGDRLQMTRRARILQFASHVFDVSVSELVSPLVYGKTIVIPSEETRLQGLELFITEKDVDWAFLTPTMARVMDPDLVPTLKTLLLGGEPIGQDNVDKWSERLQMIITWGPCETCIYSACRIVTDNTLSAENFGHAIGSSHWIVERDNASRLLPVGAVGEIVTSGPIVARGYLNDDAETGRAFIGPQSWSPKHTESVPTRYYKTGDLGRYNMDGSISFVARKDNQIKIRGQRMELHDVERHLAKLPTVAHAMIGYPREGPVAKQLVAVVSFKNECFPQINRGALVLLPSSEQVTRLLYQLKEGLSLCLPTYMIPTVWIPIQLLPRTPNGKIDRVRIRRWIEKMSDDMFETISKYHQGKGSSPPATEVEKAIQSVLSEVLNVDPTNIFRDSSFIRLGGDSITAMTVLSKCRRIGVDLSVQDILKCKSLEKLAVCATQTSGVFTRLRPEQLNVPFPLSPIQRMHLARTQTGREQFNQGFYLTVTRDVLPDSLKGALETVIQRHCALRTRFRRTSGGEWEQVIQAPSQSGYLLRVAHTCCHQERQEMIDKINSHIDLMSGPLVAAVLFMPKESDDNQRLFITAHHLVVDLVSWRIILEDLEEYLQTGQTSGHQSTNWPAWLSIQDQHFSHFKRPVASSMSIADFSFWGVSKLDNSYGDVIEEGFTLSASETSRLLQDVHAAFRTETVDFLLAATICGFMQAFPERIDIPTFYNEGHGRQPRDPSVDLSRTVGWFTSIVPLALASDSPRDFLSILVRVKDGRKTFSGSNGTDFFALNHPMTSALEILFNYSGIYQQLESKSALFTRAEPMEPMGVDPALPRFSLFAIETVIEHGELTFTLGYPRKAQRQRQILNWVARTQNILLCMIQKLPLIEPRLTLGDLSPNAGIEYSDLDHLINRILPNLGVLRADDVEDFVTCAPIQSYQLDLERRNPGALNSSFCFRLNPSKGGPVEYGRLQRAWQMVVDRNASLRTIFVRSSDGKDMQLVLKNVTASVGQYCWDDSVSPATIMASPPSPYSNGKVHSKLALYQAANGHSFCFLDLSHALFDAGSRDPLFLELTAAYDECPRSWTPRSFISAALERESKCQESYQFWQGYLTKARPSNVSTIHDPAKLGYGHGDIVVTAPSYASLKSRCASRGVTVSSFLYTAWMLLLSNETGQSNVCFNYITSGRDPRIAGINRVIGPCFNLHIAIANIQPQDSLDQVLEAVSDDFLTTLPHHSVSMTGLNRPELSNEVCNTMVNFRKFNPVAFRPPPGTTTIQAIDQSGQLAHALCLDVEERSEELYAVICYKRQQIAHWRATDVGQKLERILNMLIAKPEAQVKDLMVKLA